MSEERKWVKDNEKLEHVTIGSGNWRNFSGERTEINRLGLRKFNIFLPEGLAEELMDIGWNVKRHEPYREGDDPSYTLEIEASYDTKGGKFPVPVVTLIAYDGTRTELTEETIGMLDRADIDEATVTIRPNNWEVNERWGCKAYLEEMDVYLRMPRRARDARLNRNEEEEEF